MKNAPYVLIGIAILAAVVFFMMNQNSANVAPMTASPIPTVTAKAEMEQKTAQTVGTIPEVAKANGSFNTLLAAVAAAGLGDTLSSSGPFTVFAPTDEAFSKIPKATLDALLADPKKLTEVLTYHVVAGKVGSKEVTGLKSAKTVQGQELSISVNQGKVLINNATVIVADVPASNGVIHVIDTVLLPK